MSHAIGVASGSDALKLLLEALGVGPDAEVVTPAFSFVASATAVLQVGARPVFADVEPATLTLDPDRVAAAMTSRTRAILAVHLYGLPADMGPLRALADAQGVPLLEDAAQAFGATLGGRHVGGLGRAAAFSFYPTKNLGAYGDAGLVTTTDSGLAADLRLARNHGETQKYRHARLGWTGRLDELQAAILRVKLRHLPEWTKARQASPRATVRGSPALPLVLPAERPGATHVFHQYTVRTLSAGRPGQAPGGAPGSAPPATIPCRSRPSHCSASWATMRPPSRRRGPPLARCSRCRASPSSGRTRSMP